MADYSLLPISIDGAVRIDAAYGGSSMMALHGRLTITILTFACALLAAEARAQGVNTELQNGGKCPNAGVPFGDAFSTPHWNGWGVDPSQHRFQPSMMARLAPDDVPRLKLKWAFGYPHAVRAFAQPTVVAGRVFIGSQGGKVYSLDAHSGCIYWEFGADKSVRSAVVIGPRADGWSAYFGDFGANVYAVDAMTGSLLWKTRIEDHQAARVTGSPTLVGATLFVPVSSIEEATGANPSYPCCNFRGSVVALEALTGKLLWKGYTVMQEATPTVMSSAGVQMMGPSGAPIWSSPTFDGVTRSVYVTTGDNYSDPPTDTSDAILAFDAGSGELVWSRQMTSGDAYNLACVRTARVNCPQSNGPDYDFGSSAVLTVLPDGRRALIAGQKSGVVTALDPDRSGEIIWQRKVGRGGKLGGVQWGVAADESKVYVAVSDVKVGVVSPAVPGAQTSPINPTVALLLDNEVGGGLHALNLQTGEEVWQTPPPGCNSVPGCSPAQSAAVTAIPGVVFSGGLDGHLRAYSAGDGRIVWDVDTKREYHTVNAVAARGGSIDGPGAVVVDGVVYVNSGYGFFGTLPGNVLLAFSVDGS
jgi:polyvinyl alcohol dehydrogenase (cytochrome)